MFSWEHLRYHLLDQWNNSALFFTFFIMGISSSLHCTLMCGGMTALFIRNKKEFVVYQTSRLLSYLILLGLFSLTFNLLFSYKKLYLLSGLLSALIISFYFFNIGIKQLAVGHEFIFKLNQKMEATLYPLKNIFNQSLAFSLKSGFGKSFSLGFLTSLLPCGIIYSVLLSLGLETHTENKLIGLLAFWLGTIPSMLIGVSLLKKIADRYQNKGSRKILGMAFVVLGFSIVIYKTMHFITHDGLNCLN